MVSCMCLRRKPGEPYKYLYIRAGTRLASLVSRDTSLLARHRRLFRLFHLLLCAIYLCKLSVVCDIALATSHRADLDTSALAPALRESPIKMRLKLRPPLWLVSVRMGRGEGSVCVAYGQDALNSVGRRRAFSPHRPSPSPCRLFCIFTARAQLF